MVFAITSNYKYIWKERLKLCYKYKHSSKEDTMDLTLQIHWDGEWHDAGKIQFHDKGRGLYGKPNFMYDTHYILKALEHSLAEADQDVTDKTAVGVNIPCGFGADFFNGEIAPVLRDIIPQGASRRLWVRALGYDRDPEQTIDARLLAEGCVAPIGNLRIREAAEAFGEKLAVTGATLFSEDEVCIRADRLLEYAYELGVAIGGATGAGGDAPKLLLVENHQGQFALQGTIAESEIQKHWLVKFPRGRKTQDDIDVLRGEAAIYRVLENTSLQSIGNTCLREKDEQFSLWMPRFDRETTQNGVVRHGVESVYSLMGSIGDGAALNHLEVIQKLQDKAATPGDEDILLVDYLMRDILNTMVGNRDNHGRNTAIIKQDGGVLRLAPAYDIAPMVLDPEGIARVSRWPKDLCLGFNDPVYSEIISLLSNNSDQAIQYMAESLESLTGLRDSLIEQGAPVSMIEHPGVRLDYPEKILEELDHTRPKGPAPGG